MRFLSLFAGVGGFDLGLERAGHKCIGQVEINKHCNAVLERHWPDVPRALDVASAAAWAVELQLQPDVVCGGFPCQDVSVAGQRAGLSGRRSHLFFDAVELAGTVGAGVVLLENVPGLLSSNKGEDFQTVLDTLADTGYSYAEWRVVDSQFFGVPQRRRRLFIVASVGAPRCGPVLSEPESGSGHPRPRIPTRADIAGSITERFGKTGSDAADACANHLVCAPADTDRVREAAGFPGRVDGYPDPAGTLTTRYVKGVNTTVDDGAVVFVKAGRAQSVNHPESWKPGEVAPTLNTFDTGDSRATVAVIAEPCGCPCCPPVDPKPDGHRYRQMGNAVTVPVAEWIGQRLAVAFG